MFFMQGSLSRVCKKMSTKAGQFPHRILYQSHMPILLLVAVAFNLKFTFGLPAPHLSRTVRCYVRRLDLVTFAVRYNNTHFKIYLNE